MEYLIQMDSGLFMISIDEDLGVDYQDESPWRSYNLYADGANKLELLNSAQVQEVDQDGGEINTYDLEHSSKEVYDAAEKMINEAIDNYDPPPWCHSCGATNKKGCSCGPVAENN